MVTNVCWNTKPGSGPSQLPGHSIPLTPTVQLLHSKREKEKGPTDVLQIQCDESKFKGSLQSRGGSLTSVCFQASNITRGRSHRKSCWQRCQLMSPTGTLLARWGWLEHHVPPLYQQVPHLWLAGSRWCTAGSGYTSQTVPYITGNVE